MQFINASASAMTLNTPAWQRDIMLHISEQYSQLAIDTSDRVKIEFENIQKTIAPGYYATAFIDILHKIPRYAYIKNVFDPFGKEYEIEIDLALHTVKFIQI